MGAVHFGMPEQLALFLKEQLDLRTLVETGTYGGGTAAWGAGHFARVYSIEASEKYWREAKARYPKLDNVTFVLGNSPHELAALRPKFDRPLYWLDAHLVRRRDRGLSAGMPASRRDRGNRIARRGDHDRRCAELFLEPPPKPHDWAQWPDLAAVLAALARCGEPYVAVRDDVIVAVPRGLRGALAEFWRALPAPSHAAAPKPLLRGALKKFRR